jgi:hypothetical protein
LRAVEDLGLGGLAVIVLGLGGQRRVALVRH